MNLNSRQFFFVGILSLLLVPFLVYTAAAQDEEKVLSEQFDFSSGGTLEVDVADADLTVETTNRSGVLVEVVLRAKDLERGRQYFEDQRFEVARQGNTVYIETDPKRKYWSWDRSGGAHLMVNVRIPQTFNADLKTSDGDIFLGNLNGRALIKTSDGDIKTEAIEGPEISMRTSDGDIYAASLEAEDIAVQTSDGDIDLRSVQGVSIMVRTSDGDIKGDRFVGETEVHTSDGDVLLGTLSGPEVSIRTSDGSIRTERIQASVTEVHSSDGSLHLGTVEGELQATTASGDIRVRLLNPGDVFLKSADGDIDISIPASLRADLYLQAERVRIPDTMDFSGTLSKERADGRLLGGGVRLEARSSDGTISLRNN